MVGGSLKLSYRVFYVAEYEFVFYFARSGELWKVCREGGISEVERGWG